jgi:hypothetical protein
MIENIINIYNGVKDKTDFKLKLVKALNFEVKYGTIHTHWFSRSGGYSIPKKRVKFVLLFAQNYKKLENEIA